MSNKKRKKLERRLNDLIILHATGRASEKDLAKLEKYQNLLRPERTRAELRADLIRDYKIRTLCRQLNHHLHNNKLTDAEKEEE
ncbi:MAG: hypothetical protein AAF571_03440 [Verrucomicrobiota bacterium]